MSSPKNRFSLSPKVGRVYKPTISKSLPTSVKVNPKTGSVSSPKKVYKPKSPVISPKSPKSKGQITMLPALPSTVRKTTKTSTSKSPFYREPTAEVGNKSKTMSAITVPPRSLSPPRSPKRTMTPSSPKRTMSPPRSPKRTMTPSSPKRTMSPPRSLSPPRTLSSPKKTMSPSSPKSPSIKTQLTNLSLNTRPLPIISPRANSGTLSPPRSRPNSLNLTPPSQLSKTSKPKMSLSPPRTQQSKSNSRPTPKSRLDKSSRSLYEDSDEEGCGCD